MRGAWVGRKLLSRTGRLGDFLGLCSSLGWPELFFPILPFSLESLEIESLEERVVIIRVFSGAWIRSGKLNVHVVGNSLEEFPWQREASEASKDRLLVVGVKLGEAVKLGVGKRRWEDEGLAMVGSGKRSIGPESVETDLGDVVGRDKEPLLGGRLSSLLATVLIVIDANPLELVDLAGLVVDEEVGRTWEDPVLAVLSLENADTSFFLDWEIFFVRTDII